MLWQKWNINISATWLKKLSNFDYRIASSKFNFWYANVKHNIYFIGLFCSLSLKSPWAKVIDANGYESMLGKTCCYVTFRWVLFGVVVVAQLV